MTLEFLKRPGLIQNEINLLAGMVFPSKQELQTRDQNERNLLAGEVFGSKQVLQTLQHGFPLMRFSPGLPKDCRIIQGTRSTRTTRSSSSISIKRTSTISVSLVSTARPTKDASMGIS